MNKKITALILAGPLVLALAWIGYGIYSKKVYSTSQAREIRAKAEAGDTTAQVQLGQLYARVGGSNNLFEAASWYRKAAGQGNAEALLSLGELYEAGQGVPVDIPKALNLYRQAAEKGNPRAYYVLALRYEAGRGLPKDGIEALKWFTLAANAGQSDAVPRRDRLKAQLSKEEISEAEHRVDTFVPVK